MNEPIQPRRRIRRHSKPRDYLAHNLREAMRYRGFDMVDISIKLRMTPIQFQNALENGLLTVRNLETIAQFLDVELSIEMPIGHC